MSKGWIKGLTKETDERVRKISEFMKGNKHGLGHKKSRELRQRMSKLMRDRWKDPEYREKMILANKGKKNPLWKGGRNERTDGYILVHKPNHLSANSAGYVLEHRLVMEKMIGRRLKKSEIVHHINGKRDDNRPVNLFLETRGTHKTGYLAGYKQGYATALLLFLMIKSQEK